MRSSPSRVAHVEAADHAVAAAVERLGQAQDRAPARDRRRSALPRSSIALVIALRRGAAVVAGDERDDLDLVRLEAAQVAVLDQVVRVPVMPLVADVVADVVQAAPRTRATRARDRRGRGCAWSDRRAPAPARPPAASARPPSCSARPARSPSGAGRRDTDRRARCRLRWRWM